MEDEQVDDSESEEEEEEPEAVDVETTPAVVPTTVGQPLVLNRKYVDPPPFLDVLSFHSSRLLPVARKEIEAHERQLKKKHGLESNSSSTKTFLSAEEDASRLDALLSSVHLLLEPIQLPDLSHTGVFDPASSLLRPVTPAVAIATSKPEGEPPTKMKLSKVDKSDEVKLFYPTGAKNSNMRDYIKETIQKHFSTADLEPPRSDQTLNAAIKSPVKAALTTGALLDPQLTRQAKEIVAAVRANSSKINELIAK
ncbi:hypothetical protein PHYSODRAFT_521203 [Phytophthora sojae]|uniref:Uncharacterized protein n=1 Tax=Phytophthora sojae (strain P6497) TaxID=1094619 RepID=G5A0Q7_PHYSP|nr:hypothetical protein PHYSODRAFT_521203 [Phytophthora sojae]EGZ11393.1 hypothetical protein PHYSODRAFT_521203 [Phytophthora sojae]|eukprot:XP_009534138.1 hypothetical protein PHYSODRAFT_521203 [Phytophthora sojae]